MPAEQYPNMPVSMRKALLIYLTNCIVRSMEPSSVQALVARKPPPSSVWAFAGQIRPRSRQFSRSPSPPLKLLHAEYTTHTPHALHLFFSIPGAISSAARSALPFRGQITPPRTRSPVPPLHHSSHHTRSTSHIPRMPSTCSFPPGGDTELR
jgi:hypothetical protein